MMLCNGLLLLSNWLNFIIEVWPFLSSFDGLQTHWLKKQNLNRLTSVFLSLSSSQTGALKDDYFKSLISICCLSDRQIKMKMIFCKEDRSLAPTWNTIFTCIITQSLTLDRTNGYRVFDVKTSWTRLAPDLPPWEVASLPSAGSH